MRHHDIVKILIRLLLDTVNDSLFSANYVTSLCRYGVEIKPTTGLAVPDVSDEALAAFRQHLESHSDWALVGKWLHLDPKDLTTYN